VASNLPVQIFARDLYIGPFSGSGEWTLLPAKEDDPQHVRLIPGAVLDSLEIDQSSGRVRLYFWIDDPDLDNRYWLCRPSDRHCPRS
jgi:hypothetical protein